MPVQKFAPMTKNFPTFDCDAHVTEPPWLWERAKDWLTKDEYEALKNTIWFDPESEQLIVNGKAGTGIGSQRIGGTAGMVNVLSLAGPGLKHDIQRALNVRNLNRKTALTKEQADYLDHKGSYEPKPRLRDMDIQGIDQVMIIPTDIDTYPWMLNAVGAKAMCKAYNEWAYEYCSGESRAALFFAAMLPMQDPKFAEQEVYRVAAKGCRVGLVRPIDAMGNYPIQPKYDARVARDGRDRRGLRDASVPGVRLAQAAGLYRAVLRRGVDFADRDIVGPAAFLPDQRAEFPGGSVAVGHDGPDDGLLRALSKAAGGGLRGVLHLAELHPRRMRQELSALSQRAAACAPLKRLPSETFFEHCVTGFEGDEAPPSRLPEFYENILAWSSDVYHHDGDDAWRAIETMRKCELPEAYQAKFLGGNARKIYNIDTPKNFIRDRVTEIERPDWWPTEEEIKQSLKPEASVSRQMPPRSQPQRRERTDDHEQEQAFAVFDSDSHVVEPPELVEQIPGARISAPSANIALWREEGKLGSYLKVNGKVFRDTMNSNIPRHAIWRPGMTWDKVGELDPDPRHPMTAGRPIRRRACATWMRWASIRPPLSDLVRRGLPLVEDPDVAYALARAYNDWIADFCKAAPDRLFAAAMVPLQNMDYAVEELRRIAKIPCFRAALHPADVSRGPLLHASHLRSALGGTGSPRHHRRGASCDRAVESGVDFARPIFREDKDAA